jgi:hypothetical protein
MVEDLRKFAYDMGLPKPPSERAWGSVISSAKRDGLVEHRGFSSVKNPKAHKTPASVWVKIEI